MEAEHGHHNGKTIPQGWSSRYLGRAAPEEESNWPDFGCGSRYYPWERGESKVVEVENANGDTISFLAARFPTKLHDAIMSCQEELF